MSVIKPYPFQFVGVSTVSSDEVQIETLVYHFKSTKSGHSYNVNIEHYQHNLYCLKFYDDTNRHAKIGRFNQVTGTYEPRTIFRTVAEIALDVLRRDPKASFFFVGASDSRDTPGTSTRRYRVYTMFMKDLAIDSLFRPSFFNDISLCLLVNTSAVADIDRYIGDILSFIHG